MHRTAPLVALLTVALVSSVEAQVGGPGGGNRKVLGIATQEASGGMHDVSILWSAGVPPSTAPTDMSAGIDLLVNGTVVASTTQTALALLATDCALPVGGCDTGLCGSWDNGFEIVDGFCREVFSPVGPSCECTAYFITTLPPTPLQPGDEIMVILYPAPGALPDSDPSDDIWVQTWGEPISGPNRCLKNVIVSSISTGGPTLLIDYHVESGPTSAEIDFSTGVQVQLNGTVVYDEVRTISKDPEFGSCEGTACATLQSCANWQCPPIPAPIAGQCLFSQTQQNCACTIVIDLEVPLPSATAGDEIMVILRPAPGAIPDLPGIDDDDLDFFTIPSVGNREIVGLSMAGDPMSTGDFATSTILTFDAAQASMSPQDFSADLELLVNGVVVASTSQTAVLLSSTECPISLGCDGVCGSWDDGDTILNGICRDIGILGSPDCSCSATIVANFPPVPMQPGDEIMVILYPAPGALPDGDDSDNVWVETFQASTAGPNRRLISAHIEPGSPGVDEVHVEMAVESGHATVPLDLGFVTELWFDGVMIHETLEPASFLSSSACAITCGAELCGAWTFESGTETGSCSLSPTQGTCACTAVRDLVIPVPSTTSLQPGDEIMVILRPAPGAIPDLPGIDDDDLDVAVFPSSSNHKIVSVSSQPVESTIPELQGIVVLCATTGQESDDPQDLSYGIDLRVNGVLVESTTQTAVLLSADDCALSTDCSGVCGAWDDGSAISDAFCRDTSSDGTEECACGGWFITALPPTPLQPGDEIMVILYPAPGAIPDSDDTDDVWVQTFEGPLPAHNRRIVHSEVIPGTDSYTIHVDVALEAPPATIPLDMGFVVEVWQGGEVIDEILAPVEVTGDALCNPMTCGFLVCADFEIDGATVTGECEWSDSQETCVCTLHWEFNTIIPAPLDPDDGPTIKLVPVPGALPELPGFPDDEDEPEIPEVEPEFERGDCNVDGSHDIGDPIALLGELFSMDPPGSCEDACDANDDGGKDIGDAIYLLSALFSGGPPPPDPHPECGPDPTDDPLGCESYPPCDGPV